MTIVDVGMDPSHTGTTDVPLKTPNDYRGFGYGSLTHGDEWLMSPWRHQTTIVDVGMDPSHTGMSGWCPLGDTKRLSWMLVWIKHTRGLVFDVPLETPNDYR